MGDEQVRSHKRGRRAWDIREGEPAKAYAYFLIYRQLGVSRSLKKVAEQTGSKENSLAKVSGMFDWKARAEAFDVWSLQQRSHSGEQRVLREAALEANTVTDLVKMTRVLVRRTLREVHSNKGVKLTPQGAAVLGDIVVKLSRLARGESTDRRESIALSARQRVTEKLDKVARALKDTVAAQTKADDAKAGEPHVH